MRICLIGVYVFFIFLIQILSSFVLANSHSNSGATTIEDIKNYRNIHGYPANDQVFFSYISTPENRDSSGDALKEIVRQQNPQIPKNDLLRIIEMKQQSIHDIKSKYTVDIKDSRPAAIASKHSVEIREFTFSGNKILSEVKYPDADANTPSIRKAFDGSNVISLLNFPNANNHAGVEPPDKGILQTLFNPFSPIVVSMLFDTDKCSTAQTFFNLKNYLARDTLILVLEKTEMVNGRECLVVADMSSRIYLDIEKDFSVIQAEEFRHEFSGDILIGRTLTIRNTLLDLQDYGGGIWLPTKTKIEYFDDSGKVVCTHNIQSELTEVNKGISDDYFIGFIPHDTIVSDTARGLVYKASDSPSINALLKETAKSKRVFIYRYISVGLGLGMIFIALAMKYREYLKRKSEQNAAEYAKSKEEK